MPKPYKLRPDDMPPESTEEKAYINPLWEDSSEPPKTALDDVKDRLQQFTKKTPSTPVFEQKKVDVENPVTKPSFKSATTKSTKVGRKPTGKAMTNMERQMKWRAANREKALQRQREAMKKLRDQKKNSVE